MEQTPSQLIDEVEFREVRRGYDQAEVDAFLDRIADAMGTLHQQLSAANDRAGRAERRVAELEAAASAAPAANAAQPAAPAVPAVPAEPAASEADVQASTEQLQRTLVLAQRTADAAVKEAREEAEALRANAHAESQRIVSEARVAADRHSTEARDASVAELAELDEVRSALHRDIDLLEAHVSAHRDTLTDTIASLQRFVDDPRSLRVGPGPELSGTQVPTAGAVGSAPAPTSDPAPEPTSGVALDPEPVVEPAAAEPAAAAPDPDPAPAPVVVPATAEAPATEPVVPAPAPEPPATPTISADPVALPAAELPLDPAPTPAPPEPPKRPATDELIDLDFPDHLESQPIVDPTLHGSADSGPPTEAFDVLTTPEPSQHDDDDAFLAELRKAMTDDEPLGPHDDFDGRFPFDDSARTRPRFGRRR